MIRMTRSTLWLSMVLAFFLIIPGVGGQKSQNQAGKAYQAEEYQVTLDLQPTGTLDVTETIRFAFEEGPFTSVNRDVPRRETDQVEFSAAYMEGELLPLGSQPGQVEVQNVDSPPPGPSNVAPLKVRWHFAPLENTVQEFGLNYRVIGAVRQTPEGDTLIWKAIPEEHDYPIESAVIHLNLPPGLEPQQIPQASLRRAAVILEDRVVTVRAGNLPADTPLTITVQFPAGSLVTTPPAWQSFQHQRSQQVVEALPVGLFTGLIIVILGLIYLLMIGTQNRGNVIEDAGDGHLATPPQDLPPAMAGVLCSSSFRPTWQHALATLYDLAHRGIIEVEEGKRGLLRGRNFTIRLREPVPADLRPHEQGLIDLLFHARKGLRQEVSLSKMTGNLANHWDRFAHPLEVEMEATGYIDPLRMQDRRRAQTIMIMLSIFSGLAWIGAMVWFAIASDLGTWGVLNPAAVMTGGTFGLLLVGLVGLIVIGMYSPLTLQGEQAAEQWKSFAQYLRNLIRSNETPPSADIFDRYLPYAASFGIGTAWAWYFHRKGKFQIPAWFHSLSAPSTPESIAALVAFTSASSAGGDSGAGAGAGSGGVSSGPGD